MIGVWHGTWSEMCTKIKHVASKAYDGFAHPSSINTGAPFGCADPEQSYLLNGPCYLLLTNFMQYLYLGKWPSNPLQAFIFLYV